jgi:predicted RNA-binding Zn-ribbon protein involved in translation (DUF1610 family)
LPGLEAWEEWMSEKWIAGPEKCIECGYQIVGARPTETWGKGCECPECGEMAMYCTEDCEDDGMPLAR